MNIHETIIFIHIYMSTHKNIHCHMYKYISTDILTRLPTFSDLDLYWGSNCQWKAKSVGLIFSHSFQLIRMKIWCGDEVIQVEHPDTNFEQVLISREIAAVLLTTWTKKISIGLCSEVSELIWFKLGMMVDIIELFILILIQVTFTLIQDSGVWKEFL